MILPTWRDSTSMRQVEESVVCSSNALLSRGSPPTDLSSATGPAVDKLIKKQGKLTAKLGHVKYTRVSS